MVMQGEWAVVATCSWLQEALLIRSQLQGAGITARIPEEHTASINPGTTAMRVRVVVKSSELARAREVLELPQEPEAPSEPCPNCGSVDIRRKSNRLRNWMVIPLALFFSIPVRKSEETFCGGCGKAL